MLFFALRAMRAFSYPQLMHIRGEDRNTVDPKVTRKLRDGVDAFLPRRINFPRRGIGARKNFAFADVPRPPKVRQVLGFAPRKAATRRADIVLYRLNIPSSCAIQNS